MFQAPIGGISFLTNLILVVAGFLFRPLWPKSAGRWYIITQENITALEGRRLGFIFSRFLSWVFPVIIFTLVLGMSVRVVSRLYTDENKITVYDVARGGLKEVLIYAAPKVTTFSRASMAVINETLSDGKPANESGVKEGRNMHFVAVAGATSSEENTEIPAPSGKEYLGANEFFFRAGRDAATLSEFLVANDIDASFATRKEFADYFGVANYSGTEEQNITLHQILATLTPRRLSQLEEEKNSTSSSSDPAFLH